MANSIFSRAKKAWNVFLNRDPTEDYKGYRGVSYSYRQDRVRLPIGSERSMITSIFNRISMDAAAIDIFHVRLDGSDRYVGTIDSSLNERLNLSANIDQTGRAFKQDIVMSLLGEGAVAIVPVDTDSDPDETGSYQIDSMRTGRITEWYPRHVRVELYDDRDGRRKEVLLSKSMVSIVENPLYAVINEPNSTLQRLNRKIGLLDYIDEKSNSGKLDLIIQLPYVVRNDIKQKQAESRRKALEDQLEGSKYGVAYIDGTERVVQLNRSLDNNLQTQIEFLTNKLYSELGLTQSVMDGTADEKTMLNYYDRTVEPILSAIVDEMKRKFLTPTARTQKQSIKFFRDPFKLVPVSNLAEIADKMTRNEIMTSNEIRQVIGLKPSSDPKADQLVNSNLNQSNEEIAANNEIQDIQEDTE